MFGPITESIYGKQDVAGFFEKAAASICTGTEDCTCSDCVQAREDFDAWVEDTKRRWHNPDCGPLCRTHGDVRDTSAVR